MCSLASSSISMHSHVKTALSPVRNSEFLAKWHLKKHGLPLRLSQPPSLKLEKIAYFGPALMRESAIPLLHHFLPSKDTVIEGTKLTTFPHLPSPSIVLNVHLADCRKVKTTRCAPQLHPFPNEFCAPYPPVTSSHLPWSSASTELSASSCKMERNIPICSNLIATLVVSLSCFLNDIHFLSHSWEKYPQITWFALNLPRQTLALGYWYWCDTWWQFFFELLWYVHKHCPFPLKPYPTWKYSQHACLCTILMKKLLFLLLARVQYQHLARFQQFIST